MEVRLILLTDLIKILETTYDGEFKRNGKVIFKRVDNKYYDGDVLTNSNTASALLSHLVCGGSNTISFNSMVTNAKCLICEEEFIYDSSEGLKHTCRQNNINKDLWDNEECD